MATQATQVYYLSYPCKIDERLQGWEVVYKVSPHGKLPVPNDDDYNIDANTYEEEFFQEDGLPGSFEIDSTESIGMKVDNERVIDEDAADEIYNAKDIELLEQLHLGNDNDNISPPDEVQDYIDVQDSDDELNDNDNYDDYF